MKQFSFLKSNKKFPNFAFDFLAFAVCLIYFTVGIVFFLGQLQEARKSPLWLDEKFGMDCCVQAPVVDLIVKGANGQASPAPLFYLLLKPVIFIKEKFLIRLEPEIYLRLFTICSTVFTSWALFFIFLPLIGKNINRPLLAVTQLFILLCVPFTYFFEFLTYKHTHEMRPFAFWNSIYFLTLALALRKIEKSTLFFICTIALALCANASIFQLLTLMAAYAYLHYVKGREKSEIATSLAKIFLIPFCIALYYCFHSSRWEYHSAAWGDFYDLWSHQFSHVILLVLLTIFCFKRQENRALAIAPLSLILLFIIGPLIFLLIKLDGLFFTDRHFIYYDLIKPVTLLFLLQCLPTILNFKSQRIILIVCFAVIFIAFFLTFRSKIISRLLHTYKSAKDFYESVPLPKLPIPTASTLTGK